MAFALTNLYTYGIEADEALTKSFQQHVHFAITGTTADVSLDIGNPAGTFWTAVANPTALAAWQDILSKVVAICDFTCWELQVAKSPAGGSAIGAGLYKLTGAFTAPTLSLNAGEGLTSYNLVFRFAIKPGLRAVSFGV